MKQDRCDDTLWSSSSASLCVNYGVRLVTAAGARVTKYNRTETGRIVMTNPAGKMGGAEGCSAEKNGQVFWGVVVGAFGVG